jgi:uncharacterized protein YbgA (DUF1722 family)/uncharacterized protein YbbK (DUF523 family)
VEIRIGISACLLGEKVRFDGGHKRDPFLVGSFGRFVTWVPVCPEVELGLGTPREAIRLEIREGRTAFVMPKSGRDLTTAMREYATRRARTLQFDDLSGYVFKKGSPSCGMERVKLYAPNGISARGGRGLFAEAVMLRQPTLPVEEEGRLGDPGLRENFVERVFAYRRVRDFFSSRWTLAGLVGLHTAMKLQLMSHSPEAYARLGRLVAQSKGVPRTSLRDRYEEELMAALKVRATPRRHANVLQHMLGYFSDALTPDERQELLGLVEDHRRGLVPLIVPLTLVRHHVRRLGVAYLLGQAYLDPHPKELMLRNHT